MKPPTAYRPSRAIPLVLALALSGLGQTAHANLPSGASAVPIAPQTGAARAWPAQRAPLGPPPAMKQIARAVGALDQAAMEHDFASNARDLVLLQQARDDLGAAAALLHGLPRTRAIELASDIDIALRWTSAPLGPLASPVGGDMGPPVLSRDQLAQLATEGQDLLRGGLTFDRPIDTGTGFGGERPRRAGPAHTPPPLALQDTRPPAWPLRSTGAALQLRLDL